MNNKINVLLIEENPGDARLFIEYLKEIKSKDYTVTWIDNLNKMDEVSLQSPFDIILSDLGLPGSSGLETFYSVKKTFPETPIVILTGASDETLGEQAIREGASDYIEKNVCNAKLLSSSIKYSIERDKLAKRLKDSENKLLEMNATKDKFFSIISHDLKTPFNGIIGFSEHLIEKIHEKDYEGIDKYADIIQNAAQRTLDLLLNLLQWSQSQRNKLDFSPQHLNIFNQISEEADILKYAAHQKLIHISINLDRDRTVFVDKKMINTIFRNLISNAIKFTEEGGKIIISEEKKSEEFIFSVSDNGVGIDPDEIEKLFRIDESHSTVGTNNEKGTGLGLILCKEFIEKQGGTIWVESEVGKGSSFYFSIPCKKTKPQIINTVINDSVIGGNMKGKLVLIAEDEEVNYEYLKFVLERAGMNTLWASNGKYAVEYFNENQNIDLVLMDIKMPVMNGHEATRIIRGFNKDIRIIAQTAYASEEDKKNALEAGCDDFIGKPIKKDKLLELISNYIG